jgi:hypothetical protein
MAAEKIGKTSMFSDFNENSLQNNPRYQFSLKAENIEILPILSVAILKMAAIRSRFFFYYYYYYYSSSSSRCELVRPNSQRIMIRSLLNFTGR